MEEETQMASNANYVFPEKAGKVLKWDHAVKVGVGLHKEDGRKIYMKQLYMPDSKEHQKLQVYLSMKVMKELSSHPNIATMLDVCMIDDQILIVEEKYIANLQELIEVKC